MWDWWIGLICSLVIAGAAYSKRSLSGSGAAAAVVVGTLLYSLGSLPWYGTLIIFFITSTVLTKWRHRQKAAVESGYAKSGRRDAGQVFANGGLGTILCIGHSLWPSPLWWAAYVGVMATVTADTWATEIGGLSRSEPRSIVNGLRVSPGTSGGITGAGLAASLAGGLAIGISAWLFGLGKPELLHSGYPVTAAGGIGQISGLLLLLLGAAGGLLGSLADSWMGAVWQVMYRCQVCGKQIEKNHHCGMQAVRIRGGSWMSNDAVNMISSLVGGAVCLSLYYFFMS